MTEQLERKIADAIDVLGLSLDCDDNEGHDAHSIVTSACDIALWAIREGLAERARELGYGAFLWADEENT